MPYGQFWYGPMGFLYKRNNAIGARRSTKFVPGGTALCNQSTYIYNKWKPGSGGVGASSIANRRAKNRLATVCSANQHCGSFYSHLGMYDSYTYNPNGYYNFLAK